MRSEEFMKGLCPLPHLYYIERIGTSASALPTLLTPNF